MHQTQLRESSEADRERQSGQSVEVQWNLGSVQNPPEWLFLQTNIRRVHREVQDPAVRGHRSSGSNGRNSQRNPGKVFHLWIQNWKD